jgi:hypothetical protein
VAAPRAAGAFVCVAPTAWPETGFVHEFYPLGDAGVVIGADQGVFRMDATSKDPKRLSGPSTGPIFEMQQLHGGGALIRAERGIFSVDAAARRADPVRGPATGALLSVEAIDGGALIVAEKGLFAVAPGMSEMELVNNSGVGGPYAIRALAGNVALVAAQDDLFRLRAADSGLKRLDGPSPGKVQSFYRLQDGGVLLLTDRGLFYADADGSKLRSANRPELGTVREIRPLEGGGALIRTDQILFQIQNATDGLRQVRTGLERPLDPDSWSPGWIHALASGAPMPRGFAVIGTDAGAFIVDIDANTLTSVDADVTGGVSAIASAAGGIILIGADRGLFRLGLAPPDIAPAGGPSIGAVDEIHALKNGVTLIEARAGLFRLDAAGRITGITGPDLGTRRSVHALDDGGALIDAERGLFYLAATGSGVQAITGPRIDGIDGVRSLADGAFIAAGGRLYQFDRNSSRIGPIAAPDRKASIRRFFPLGDGTALISDGRANTGLAVADFATADVRLGNLAMVDNRRPGAPPAEAHWTLEHRCAPVAGKLGLVVLARRGSDAASAPLRLLVLSVEDGTTMAAVTAGITFPENGKWSLQLAATSSGVDLPLGAPVVISAEDSIWNWLKP